MVEYGDRAFDAEFADRGPLEEPQSAASREMTLTEYINRLPKGHAARREHEGRFTQEVVGRAERLLEVRREAFEEAAEVLRPIDDAVRQHPHGDIDHDSWNEDAHLEITLTVGECRKVRALIALAKEKPDE